MGFFMDWIMKPTDNWKSIDRYKSYDWCRFRGWNHCWRSDVLDQAGSEAMGYAVWVPVDQGHCPKHKWSQQQACPIGQAGPHTAGGFTDATVAWADGGQRNGFASGPFVVQGTSSHEGGKIAVGTDSSQKENTSTDAPVTSTPLRGDHDVVDELERLATLRRDDSISEAEFVVLKAKVLRDSQ